ncbi:MAG: hypothetical protein JXR94_03890 [Candidatus Hydrogenedentes bacterium]|nr:hypothetical protein [Candidatus Hydrogenedentota bacterium]
MHAISIHLLRPGQVVAQPVTNPRGGVLCPVGFRLTEASIERLRTAGVQTVSVEGTDEGPSIVERIERLHRRFEGIDDPILLQIKAAIEKRLEFERLQQEA